MNPKQARQTNQGKSKDQWATPLEIIKVVRKSLGGSIAWDLASSEEANIRVKARNFYSLQKRFQDNHTKTSQWKRGFWVNPPFSEMKDFVGILASQKKGSLTGLVLCNSNTETKWYQSLLQTSDSFVLLNKRIQFIPPKGIEGESNPSGQTIFSYGVSLKGFGDQGIVCRKIP